MYREMGVFWHLTFSIRGHMHIGIFNCLLFMYIKVSISMNIGNVHILDKQRLKTRCLVSFLILTHKISSGIVNFYLKFICSKRMYKIHEKLLSLIAKIIKNSVQKSSIAIHFFDWIAQNVRL